MSDEATDPKTPDQHKLRDFANRVKALMDEEGVGGCVVLTSQESHEWLVVIPEWSGITETSDGVRVELSSKNPEQASQTMGLLAGTRDMCGELARVFGDLYINIKTQLELQGAEVDHRPFADIGYGPTGPKGRN